MLFGKKFDDKEVECIVCHKKVKPIMKRNRFKDNFIMTRWSGLEKKISFDMPTL
jgi:hypothetical protein